MKHLILTLLIMATIGFASCSFSHRSHYRPKHTYFIKVGEVRTTRKAGVFLVRATNNRTGKVVRNIIWRVHLPSVQVGDRIEVWDDLIIGPRF